MINSFILTSIQPILQIYCKEKIDVGNMFRVKGSMFEDEGTLYLF